jgi:hypothetical protein
MMVSAAAFASAENETMTQLEPGPAWVKWISVSLTVTKDVSVVEMGRLDTLYFNAFGAHPPDTGGRMNRDASLPSWLCAATGVKTAGNKTLPSKPVMMILLRKVVICDLLFR